MSLAADRGDQNFESTLKFTLRECVLSGSVPGTETPNGKGPDIAIGGSTFKDDKVSFRAF